MLNTKETRKLVKEYAKFRGVELLDNGYGWTNRAMTNGKADPRRRNLCFEFFDKGLTKEDMRYLHWLTGCKKVHQTHSKHTGHNYIRLQGVKFGY